MVDEAKSQPGACTVIANNNNRGRLRLVCRVIDFLWIEGNQQDMEPQAVVAGVGVAVEAALAVGYMVVAVLTVRRWRRRQRRERGGAGRAAFSWCGSSVTDVPVNSSSSLTCPDSVHRQSVDFPIMRQRRVPTVQTVQPTAETLQVLFWGEHAGQVPASDTGGASASVHRQRVVFLVENRDSGHRGDSKVAVLGQVVHVFLVFCSTLTRWSMCLLCRGVHGGRGKNPRLST